MTLDDKNDLYDIFFNVKCHLIKQKETLTRGIYSRYGTYHIFSGFIEEQKK